jgi:hypothetical protein
VGWVYWGRPVHNANNQIKAISHLSPEDIQAGPAVASWKMALPRSFASAQTPPSGWDYGQRQAQMEYWALRDLGVYELVLDHFHTRDDLTLYPFSLDLDRGNLADRLAAGPVEQAGPPSPGFLDLQHRLGLAGIHMALSGEAVRFRFGRPPGNRLRLAAPVPHPWLHERLIDEVGLHDAFPEAQAVAETSARLERMLASHVPAGVAEPVKQQLHERLTAYFDRLFDRYYTSCNTRVLFSGRAVLVPGPDLSHDRIGLPEDMAWVLFGPLVARETGSLDAVKRRTPEAEKTLDALMDRHWVVITRAPVIELTNMLAFRPVRRPDHALHVHPFFSPLMHADFDGDLSAVFLPVTEAAQKEAEARLSIVGQATRDPAILHGLVEHEAIWGLAYLSLTPKGRREITRLAGTAVDMEIGYLTQRALDEAIDRVFARDGARPALDALERLMRRGFEAAKRSGASIGPFFDASIDRSRRPDTDDPKAWEQYADELLEQVMARTDFDDPDLGAALLSIRSGARGVPEHLRRWIGAAGNFIEPDLPSTESLIRLGRGSSAAVHFIEPDGALVPVRTSLSEGMSLRVLRAEVFGSHRGLTRQAEAISEAGRAMRQARLPKGFNVFARAARNPRPGVVFARAAAIEEVDPLLDVDSRLFVGLRPRG